MYISDMRIGDFMPIAARVAGSLLLSGMAFAAVAKPDPSPGEVEKIIAAFAQNEAAFADARARYTYRQTAKMSEFDAGGVPGGKFELVSDILFTPEGKRTEHIVRAPAPSLHLIQMSPEDEKDMRDVLPFVLTKNDIGHYYVRYLGRENADEIPCYVFAVKPKSREPGQRYFAGEVWVDDRDLMIVKSYGRSTGLLRKGNEQQFPKFETYREQVDGKYWFPTYTLGNSTLHFKEGDIRVRVAVKYEDYKQFKSESTITFGDEVDQKGQPKEPPKQPNKP